MRYKFAMEHVYRVHLVLIQCYDTRGESIHDILVEHVDKFKIREKIFASIKDGGSNLRACVYIIKSSTSSRLAEIGFVQIISGALSSALSKVITE